MTNDLDSILEDPEHTPADDDAKAALAMPHGEVVTEDDAKQGNRGLTMFRVMAASIALVVLAFIVIYALHARHTPAPAAQPAPAATQNGV